MAEKTLRITQTRSVIGRTQDQRATVRSLGLKRIRHTVEQPDRPEIRGMLRKIPHLVSFEVVDAPKGNTQEEVVDAPKGNTQEEVVDAPKGNTQEEVVDAPKGNTPKDEA
jgi:large subunit ribosomal protein L30